MQVKPKQLNMFVEPSTEIQQGKNSGNELENPFDNSFKWHGYIKDALEPFKDTQFKVISPEKEYSNLSDADVAKTRKPLSSFAIIDKNAPEQIEINGQNSINYLLGRETKYYDQDGKTALSDVPAWVFNREGLRQKNFGMIDEYTDLIKGIVTENTGNKVDDIASKLKRRQADLIDEFATKYETKLNVSDATIGNNTGRKLLNEVSETIPKILDSDVHKIGNKAIGIIGDTLQLGSVLYTLDNDYFLNKEITGMSYKKIGGVLGDYGGSALCSWAGAALGSALGIAVSGGVLSPVFAAVGGYLGNVAGGYLGEKLGESAGELVYEFIDD